ncbi:MAG: hypothetical protein RIT24_628 [Planctomycetota bacterium]
MSNSGRVSTLLAVVAVGVGLPMGTVIGLQLFQKRVLAVAQSSIEPGLNPTLMPAPTGAARVVAADDPSLEVVSKPARGSRQFVWSTASGARSGITTIHWHRCTWASKISAINRASLAGTWEQVTNRVGGPCRRCSVCEQLD